MNALERFQREYQDYHGISEGRRKEQIAVLTAFAAHAGVPLLDAKPDQLRAFLADEIAAGRHPNTVARKNKMIRPFYRWAFDVELIDGDRLMRMQAVPHPAGSSQSAPRPYTAKELAQFRAELDARWPMVDPKWWPRYRRGASRYKRVASEVMRLQIEAIVALALHGGLRRREIFHLAIEDMHPQNAYIVVRQRAQVANGKDRMREVPYTEAARAKVERWLTMRAEIVGDQHDSPWIVAVSNVREGDWRKPMGFERFAELLTTIGDWQLHRFRHTSATMWLRAGVKLELVSRYLGHARIQQTLAYAELIRDDIQVAVERNESRFARLIGETDETAA